jgi:hypothetical protein
VGGVTEEGGVEVAVKRNGIPAAGSPKTAKARHGAQLAEFTGLSANGIPYTTETAVLTLNFGGLGIPDLGTDDIYLNAGGTGAIRGTPGGSGPNRYTLGVSGITAEGEVIVSVNKAGYSTYPSLQRAPARNGALAEGGDVSLDGIYEIHVFDQPGDSYALTFADGRSALTADYLIVAGGGGAGGLPAKGGQTLPLENGSVTVKVGRGGTGGQAHLSGEDGGYSVIGGHCGARRRWRRRGKRGRHERCRRR